MSELGSKTALVIDHGLFLPVAFRLAEEFERVLYHTCWENGFARIQDCVLGDGFDNIERCDDPWLVKKEVDLFVFPDIYHSGMQLELESQGYPVWGSRTADSFEMNRTKFHRSLGELGLQVPKFETVVGMTSLREYLKDKKNVFIKISKYRGNFETAHWGSWEEDENSIDNWAVEFGPTKELIKFLVFEPIGDDLEIGGDTFCVDGQWPDLMLRGDEYKDKSYIGAVTKRGEMPEQIREVMEAFGFLLGNARYRNQFSMELRGEGDNWYFIDPTCRGGLPSTASQLNNWKNFPEIVWKGAHGELVQPEPAFPFTVECCLTLFGEKHAWRSSRVSSTLREAARLGRCCLIKGNHCWPHSDHAEDEVGWLQCGGESIKEAIEGVKALAEDLPDGMTAKTETLVNLLKEIHSGEEQGVKFTDAVVPEPESVVADD